MNILYEKRVGNNIRKYREKIGMTQNDLAAKLQIPYLIWLTFAAYLSAGVWLLNG